MEIPAYKGNSNAQRESEVEDLFETGIYSAKGQETVKIMLTWYCPAKNLFGATRPKITGCLSDMQDTSDVKVLTHNSPDHRCIHEYERFPAIPLQANNSHKQLPLTSTRQGNLSLLVR